MIASRAWRLPIVVLASMAALLLLPPLLGLTMGVVELLRGDAASPRALGFRGGATATVAWSLAVAATASVIGLGPGRRLAARPRLLEAAAWMVPVLISPALLFDAWWLEVGPDSWLGSSAARHDRVALLRRGVLALGLLGAAVPLAVWAHASLGVPGDATLRRLDRPRGIERLTAWFRLDLRPILRVTGLVALVVAGLTVPFDLAQVGSWGFELRSLDTRGATPGTLVMAGSGAVLLASLASLLVVRQLHLRPHRSSRTHAGDARGTVGIALGVLLIAVPVALLIRRGLEADLATAWRLHAPAAWNTLFVGGMGTMVGGAVALLVSMLRLGGPRGGRVTGVLIAAATLVALLPATLVAVGVEATWNRSVTSAVYDGPWALILAVGGRVAIVPAILGHLATPMPGRSGGGPLALDAPRRFGDAWRGARPVLTRAVVVGGLAGGVLSMAEIPVTARLQPPGFPVLSSALLNAMHYQYVDSVLPIVLPVAIVAIPIALVAAMLLRRLRRVDAATAALLVATVAVMPPGCDRGAAEEGLDAAPAPVAFAAVFGRPGNIDGRFDYPRAIALDAARDRLFVVDKSARVQRFSLDGEFELSWRMPRFDDGKPTGITIDSEGRVIVADTHEHRVAVFSPEGELLETHGGMGEEPGRFIYPTDVVAGPDGRWFVSEYGGNDRVQVFDRDWNPIGVIGFAGWEDDGDRPALSRPQSIAWHAARGELFIADAIHHRIVVVDADGRILRVLGGPGFEPGNFSYPYGIAVDGHGDIVVVEYGANRVQRIDPVTGACLGMAGGTGIEPGRLRYPWAVDVDGDVMAILDSGNARVLVGPVPDAGS